MVKVPPGTRRVNLTGQKPPREWQIMLNLKEAGLPGEGEVVLGVTERRDRDWRAISPHTGTWADRKKWVRAVEWLVEQYLLSVSDAPADAGTDEAVAAETVQVHDAATTPPGGVPTSSAPESGTPEAATASPDVLIDTDGNGHIVHHEPATGPIVTKSGHEVSEDEIRGWVIEAGDGYQVDERDLLPPRPVEYPGQAVPDWAAEPPQPAPHEHVDPPAHRDSVADLDWLTEPAQPADEPPF